ncbi:MAG: hypothetical protein ACLQVD_18565 [Capsulimonadaceae bacterium]
MIAAEYTEDAENDILDAARWYQNQRHGLGTAYSAEFDRSFRWNVITDSAAI